jgi:hypothetical protein
MRTLVITVGALLALAISASASAADTTRWVTDPSCSATTTTLTCTGRGAGLQRPNNNPLGVGLGPPEAAILGEIHYICSGSFGSFTVRQSGGPFDETLSSTAFQNGQTFSIEHSPLSEPFGMGAQVVCAAAGGVYTRDPNYYNVSVAIGFGFGSGHAVVLLETPIGTVLAQ